MLPVELLPKPEARLVITGHMHLYLAEGICGREDDV